MNSVDLEYNRLLNTILINGKRKTNRTGIDTIGVFGEMAKFDVRMDAFPILTTKRVWFKGIVHELLWFIKGDTNIKYLVDNGVHIWDDWREPYGFKRQLVFVEKRVKPYVGYHGDFSWEGFGISGEVDTKLVYLWEKMMRRCYDSNHHRFPLYGGVGVSVCETWHNPKTFVEQVKQISHWWYKENNWNDFELDKDYYGAKQYGPDTCVWLHTKENNFYTKVADPVEVKDLDGNRSVYLTANDAAREIGMSQSSFNRILNDGFPKIIKGNNRNYIGWEFNVLRFEDKLLRMELIPDGELGFVYGRAWRNFEGVDQLAKVIDKLKTNPDDRRMIVSAWHPYWVDHCSLPPCHCLFHFNTEELTLQERVDMASTILPILKFQPAFQGLDNKAWEEQCDKLEIPTRRLNLLMYQRSLDFPVGGPFNITSYSLLLAMVAHCVGMETGEFTWSTGDTHIYVNQLDGVNEQLKRGSYPLPKLWLNPDKKNLFDFKYDDIKLVDYISHPTIKFPVAV